MQSEQDVQNEIRLMFSYWRNVAIPAMQKNQNGYNTIRIMESSLDIDYLKSMVSSHEYVAKYGDQGSLIERLKSELNKRLGNISNKSCAVLGAFEKRKEISLPTYVQNYAQDMIRILSGQDSPGPAKEGIAHIEPIAFQNQEKKKLTAFTRSKAHKKFMAEHQGVSIKDWVVNFYCNEYLASDPTDITKMEKRQAILSHIRQYPDDQVFHIGFLTKKPEGVDGAQSLADLIGENRESKRDSKIPWGIKMLERTFGFHYKYNEEVQEHSPPIKGC